MSRKSASVGIHISLPSTRQQGGARTIVIVGAFFLLGLALSAAWFHWKSSSGSSDVSGESTANLSDATKTILAELSAPVEIRFYSVLDPTSVPEGTRAFALRVDQLLAAYQSEAGSRLKVNRVQGGVGPQAAADGLLAFNQDKGDACYLGLVVSSAGQKEIFGRLSPEWEAAFESDLSRAILRVTRKTPAVTATSVSSAQPEASTIAALKQQLPNLATVSVAEGSQTLRTAALEKFRAAVAEMQSESEKAQKRLAAANAGGSAAEQEAAAKNYQQVQSEQTAKLQKITAELQSKIEALQNIKQP